jgi:NTE family protein
MPLGILDLDRLMDFLNELLGERMTFDKLPIPFAAIATDIAGGQMVVMNDGEIAPAIRASCAVPGIFTPIRRRGRLLIDGGAVNNLPVSIARQLGAEYVIAVDLLPRELNDPKEPTNIVELSLMSLYALVRATQSDGQAAHLTIQPEIAHIRLMDLGAAPELIAAGRIAAQAAIPQLLRVLGRTFDPSPSTG